MLVRTPRRLRAGKHGTHADCGRWEDMVAGGHYIFFERRQAACYNPSLPYQEKEDGKVAAHASPCSRLAAAARCGMARGCLRATYAFRCTTLN